MVLYLKLCSYACYLSSFLSELASLGPAERLMPKDDMSPTRKDNVRSPPPITDTCRCTNENMLDMINVSNTDDIFQTKFGTVIL
jgi:hypothetical protein